MCSVNFCTPQGQVISGFPMEKEMATHSSILAWRIPWMEEPGGLGKESDTTERLHFHSILASQVELVVKHLHANAGDIRNVGLIPGSGKSPGGGHGNPLWNSCLENPMDREAWRATAHRVAELNMMQGT